MPGDSPRYVTTHAPILYQRDKRQADRCNDRGIQRYTDRPEPGATTIIDLLQYGQRGTTRSPVKTHAV